jgi:TolB-like protein/Tfp pilus assembly protein PilF
MAGDKGIDESSEAVSQPPAATVAAGSRTVFLSYASPDAAVANQVCEFLESHSVACWMAPRDVKPGAAYADAIVRAINEASALVLVLSGAAMASEHVSREVERAASKHKPVVAFRVDGANLSAELEYFLSRSQWIDVPTLGMPGAFAKLAEAVGRGSAASSSGNLGLGGGGAAGRADINQAVGTASVAKRVLVAAAIVIVLGIGGVLAVRFWQSKHGEGQTPVVAAISDKSIAVLPFADLSEKHDQEYFADGMAEEIIDLMARIPGLKVIGRTSSFQFKGHNEDLRTIGSKLGVAYVLEGSVRKFGDRVRVTAQLIEVTDGSHRWSGTYDRDLVDVLKAQEDISVGLVRALQLSMGTDEPVARPLKNVDAYALYLRGRQAFDRFDKAGFEQAASYFRQAVQLDPESALAPAWLAFVIFEQAANGFVQPTGFEDARHYAERARSLDPRLELASGVLGFIHISYDWDWDAGAVELDRALALAPGNARMLLFHSAAPWALGQWDSAIRDLSAAVALDPLYPAAYNLLGVVQLGAGHWSEAEVALNKALDIAPHYALVHFDLAKALLLKGDKQAALQQIALEPDETAQWAGRAAINHALGRKADSDAALKRLTERASTDLPYVIAAVYAYRGETDAAFLWLERAFNQKENFLWEIKGEPFLNSLKGDPRYKAFLHKMNLPE